jgi:hypothetical protein
MQSILHSIIGPSGPETADLTGKVAIVTGGPLGIVSAAASITSSSSPYATRSISYVPS